MFRHLLLSFFFLSQLTLLAEVSPPFKLSLKQQEFIKQIPADFTYGWLEVPENYSKPAGEKIHVFYFGTKPKIKNSIPIAIFNGGPADGTHGYFYGLRRFSRHFNFVFIDQRGAGLSTPYPQASKENIIRYKNYLSTEIVRDAEKIRQHLYKDKKWSVAGHSFGSLIVHRYLELFPQSLHSAHAHGWGLSSDAGEYPYMRLKAHHKTLESYLKLYPEDEALLKEISESFTGDDFITDGDFKLKGRAIFDYMSLFTFGMKSSWSQFHKLLHSNFLVDGKINKEAVKASANFMLIRHMGIGTRQALINIVFNRLEAYETGEKSLTDAYKELFDRLKKEGNDPYKWVTGEEAFGHFGLEHPVLKEADTMNLGSFNYLRMKNVYKGLHSQPSLKFYLYSSEHDAFSPPEIYKEFVNQGSSQLVYMNFPDSGHEGFLTESFFWRDLKRATKIQAMEAAH